MSHPSDTDAMLPDHPLPEDDPTYCASCCSFYPNKSLLGICLFFSRLQNVQKGDSVLYVDMQKWPRCEDCGVGGQNLPPGNPRLCGTCKSGGTKILKFPKLFPLPWHCTKLRLIHASMGGPVGPVHL
ncbi:hypothetical protein K439DRAFT_891270 [Ramaria rubella]|nr:hypothetical protein K439DRAFT_891270 [Ramaria rubella]